MDESLTKHLYLVLILTASLAAAVLAYLRTVPTGGFTCVQQLHAWVSACVVRQTDTQTDSQTDRQRDRHQDVQRVRQTGKQADRQVKVEYGAHLVVVYPPS